MAKCAYCEKRIQVTQKTPTTISPISGEHYFCNEDHRRLFQTEEARKLGADLLVIEPNGESTFISTET